MKNLKKSVYLVHKDISLHWISHFHLSQFGHDSIFNLFMFLSTLYNKKLKQQKKNLFNYMNEKLRVQFMNECLLLAIKEVMILNKH
jgi:hypothetical protein